MITYTALSIIIMYGTSLLFIHLLGNFGNDSSTYKPCSCWTLSSNHTKCQNIIRPALHLQARLNNTDIQKHFTLPHAHMLTSVLLLFYLTLFYFLQPLLITSVWISPARSTHVMSLLNYPTLVISRNELWL